MFSFIQPTSIYWLPSIVPGTVQLNNNMNNKDKDPALTGFEKDFKFISYKLLPDT